MPAVPRIYWPTSTWLAFLDPEGRGHATLLPGCREVMSAVDAGEVELIISELVKYEAFKPAEDGRRPWDVVETLLQRPAFVYAELSLKDREEALNICELADADSKAVPPTDGEHLAMALRLRATEFHTNNPRVLALSGHPAVRGLLIRPPGREQLDLL